MRWDRPDRTPDQAERPAHPARRGAIREHGEGGERACHLPSGGLAVDQPSWSIPSACASWSETRAAWSSPSLGRAILNRSHAAFDELRQGVKDIEFLADPTAGKVRIGTTPPLAASFISAVIDRLSKRYPRILFHITVKTKTTMHSDEI